MSNHKMLTPIPNASPVARALAKALDVADRDAMMDLADIGADTLNGRAVVPSKMLRAEASRKIAAIIAAALGEVLELTD